MHDFVNYLDKNPHLIGLFKSARNALGWVTRHRWATAYKADMQERADVFTLSDAVMVLASDSGVLQIAPSGLLVPLEGWGRRLNDAQQDLSAYLALDKLGFVLAENTVSEPIGLLPKDQIVQDAVFLPGVDRDACRLRDYYFTDAITCSTVSVKVRTVTCRYQVVCLPTAHTGSSCAYNVLQELGILLPF